ncbi:MAG TPA: 23S rRNA (guanosine(2251)-2'-O)-methyltransferase RlmB [Solirubrobacterales bacterium]|nr:23S rRNA (guanosine(2251)-2'-O)-methyltransferase RlmB [Solirubrobacterales bacterium]
MAARRSRDRAVVYGRNAVAEAERGRRRVHRVWRAPEVDAAELTRLAGSPDHQGVVAEVDAYPYAEATSLLDAPDAFVVALDQVQDPRNLGAVCRSAEVAGAAGVVVPARRSAAVTPVAAKASAGAVEHLAVARVRNLAEWVGGAKRDGAWVYGASADAPTRYDAIDWSGRVVLVLGGEGKGIRPRVAGACDATIAIPQRGRIRSLNVAAAASVLLFEAARQRGTP